MKESGRKGLKMDREDSPTKMETSWRVSSARTRWPPEREREGEGGKREREKKISFSDPRHHSAASLVRIVTYTSFTLSWH